MRVYIVSPDDAFVGPIEARLKGPFDVQVVGRLDDLQIPATGVVPVVIDTARVTGGVERASKVTRLSKRVAPILAVTESEIAELPPSTDGGLEFVVKPVEPVEIEARVKLLNAKNRKHGELEVYITALENRLNSRTEEMLLSKERSRTQVVSIVHALQRVLQARHVYTEGHSRRVARTTVAIARQLALPPESIKTVELAAVFHDIGKIGIRDDVLNKAGKLTDVEYEHMKTHPLIAEQILQSIEGFESIVKIVKHEHEWWDGRGYPDRLKGEQIPLGSRVIAVADAWDSMIYDRAYRAASPRAKAAEEIKRGGGTQFDPAVVDAFATLTRTTTDL